VNALIHQAHKRILLNFEQVTYLDQCGVGAIAWKFVTAKKRDGDVKLLNLRTRTHKVLATTRLLSVSPNFESEAEAIDSFVDAKTTSRTRFSRKRGRLRFLHDFLIPPISS